MAQHFLLSAAARTLSLKTIFSEGEDAAYRRFRRLRWPETAGAPVCPVCSCLDIYAGIPHMEPSQPAECGSKPLDVQFAFE